MTEVRHQRSAVRNQRTEINRRDAECAKRFLCALCAYVFKPISHFRLLISGLCAMLLAHIRSHPRRRAERFAALADVLVFSMLMIIVPSGMGARAAAS